MASNNQPEESLESNNESDLAQRPNFYADFPSLNKTDKLEKKESEEKPDPEDEALYHISLSGGWKLIEDYITELEQELNVIVRQLMEQGASFEAIGQKTMVKEVATAYLERVRAKVNDAREVMENKNNG